MPVSLRILPLFLRRNLPAVQLRKPKCPQKLLLVADMTRVPFVTILSRAARRFGRDRSGNIAVLFGISLIPILTFVGAAVDYSRKNAAQTSMQAALDSTALMLSRDLAEGTITTADLTTTANKYFQALYTSNDAPNPSLTATYEANTSSGSHMELTANGAITTDFMKIVGFPT